MLLCKIERELLLVYGPGFISISPASKSNKISTILKYKLYTISLITNDNNLQGTTDMPFLFSK